MILSFTSSSFAYGKNANEAKQLLTDELKRKNAKARYYFVADVSHVPDGVQILHDFNDGGQMVCQTSEGVAIPFKMLEI